MICDSACTIKQEIEYNYNILHSIDKQVMQLSQSQCAKYSTYATAGTS